MPPSGRLQIQTLQGNSYIPIENANVTLTSAELGTKQVPKVAATNSSGMSEEIELTAPPLAYSMKPSNKIPYSLYDLKVSAAGYKDILVKGIQIYPDQLALEQCNMVSKSARQEEVEIIDIGPNRLVGNYPPKIPEDPDKPEPKPPSGFVVLPEPVVPGLVVVHQGDPNDPSAPNYTVGYKQYVKNVASCEIFSTWPANTIRANVYCIISFTLNRIYTEWYRGKGKNFDISSSTAYDHAFIYGRNIYANISRIVDSIFSTYMKRPAKKQPLLAQYCDGSKVKCSGWLTQWGSKYLGDRGKTPYEILTNFYGTNLNLTTAKKVSGIPMSYPGRVLRPGSSGAPVRTIQTYLNRIAVNYPAIPKQAVNGYYGAATTKAVKAFQQIFYLPKIGVVDYPTWYKISDIYVAVTKIAELRGENDLQDTQNSIFAPPVPYNNLDDNIPKIHYPNN